MERPTLDLLELKLLSGRHARSEIMAVLIEASGDLRRMEEGWFFPTPIERKKLDGFARVEEGFMTPGAHL